MLVTRNSHSPNRSARVCGQALVEFAFVITALVLLLMGMFDLGYGIYSYNVVASAAREGARYGITSPTETETIKDVAMARAVGIGLDRSQISVSCQDNGGHRVGDCLLGYDMTVVVPYTFRPMTLFFSPFTVTGKSTMAVVYHP